MSGTTIKSELPVSRPQAEEALRLVLQSQTFARAEKLQRFLKYVSELTFRGDAGLVHEHLVAVEVFGRGEAYSPGEDSVVRRQAHALRRKLKDYYETEGKIDPVRIELPLGSYVPVFRDRSEPPTPDMVAEPASSPAQMVVPPPPAAPFRAATSYWVYVLGAVLASFGIFSAGWASRGMGTPTRSATPVSAPAVAEIWGAWLSHSDGAVVAFSNPPAASVRLFPGPIQPNPEHQGLSVTPGQDARFREFYGFKDGGNIYLYPLAAQAKMGEALAAVSLTAFFTSARLPVRATQSRLMTWETLRQENVILLGHADSNQWIEPVLRAAPFTLAATDQQHRARIVNQHPQAGEQSHYLPTLPGANKSYALVSMLPGLDGSHQILVIGGLDTSSTTVAAEYLMTPGTARELLGRLKGLAPDHKGPWHFQAVLETDVRDTVPLKAFAVALRVL